jgi:hypothetical protein
VSWRAPAGARRPASLALPLLALGLCALAGCASAPRSPEETVAAYEDALRRGDQEGASALVASAAIAPDLPTLPGSGPAGPAWRRWRADTGASVITLEETATGVRFTSGVLGFFAQDTPEAAARAFALAVRDRRVDVLARLVPASRAPLSPEAIADLLERGALAELSGPWLDAVGQAQPGSAARIGDARAHLEAQDKVVILVREDGHWKVEDVR